MFSGYWCQVVNTIIIEVRLVGDWRSDGLVILGHYFGCFCENCSGMSIFLLDVLGFFGWINTEWGPDKIYSSGE